MANRNCLVFDFGASHGRCILAAYNGKTIDFTTIHDFENGPVSFSDILYWDILHLISEMGTGIQKAKTVCNNIDSIGIDTWGCDFGFIDGNGKLQANPISYRDKMRYTYKKELDNIFGEYELFKLGGVNTNNIMGLYNLYAMKRENAAEFGYAKRLLMIPDLLNYALTGIATNEFTDATMSLMVDQEKLTWQDGIIDRLGFPKKLFGDLIFPGTTIGKIQNSVCEELGINPIDVISVASHDTASAIAGIPHVGSDRDWAFLSLGTWAIYGVETDRLYLDRKTFDTGFANQGGCEKKNNLVNLFTGLWVIQECYRKWKIADGSITWDTITKAALECEDQNSVIDLDHADFAQPNANMPEAVMQFCQRTLQAVPKDMGSVASCIYRSLVLKIKQCFENIRTLTGKDYRVLHIVGGGSKNALLCQWIADALGITVEAGPAETTSVGNFIMQLKGLKEIDSVSDGRAIAADTFQTKTYMPGDGSRFDRSYGEFLKILQRKDIQ